MKMCDLLCIMNRAELLRRVAYLRASTPRGALRSLLDISMGSAPFASLGMSQVESLGRTVGLSSSESAVVLARPGVRPYSAFAVFVVLLVLFFITVGVFPYVLAGQGTPSTYTPGTRYASISPRDFE